MFNWIKRMLTKRAQLKVAKRRAANQWFIAAGGPCHDPEFWEREKDYL
jgi:hypothetical protein